MKNYKKNSFFVTSFVKILYKLKKYILVYTYKALKKNNIGNE